MRGAGFVAWMLVSGVLVTVAPSAWAAPAAPESFAVYQVQAGDTLWAISRRYGTTPDRLAALNRISVDSTLRIGQTLKVPGRAVPRPRGATIPARGGQWASDLVGLSTRYLGVRYRWGGATPEGFDCSGFLNYVFERMGVTLPRTTYAMFGTAGSVLRQELQVGDIVFFETVQPGASHAGIYLGDGRFIHASSGAGRVTISSLDDRYYAPRYLGARRF